VLSRATEVSRPQSVKTTQIKKGIFFFFFVCPSHRNLKIHVTEAEDNHDDIHHERLLIFSPTAGNATGTIDCVLEKW